MQSETSYLSRFEFFVQRGQFMRANKVITEGLDQALREFAAVFNGADASDLPLYLAAIRAMTHELTESMPPDGKIIAEFIYSRIRLDAEDKSDLFRSVQPGEII